MADTMQAAGQDTGTETKTPRERKVTYVDEFVTELPKSERMGAVRTSPIRDKVEELRSNEAYHSTAESPHWRALGQYEVKGSASGSQKSLRDFFGRKGSGFKFEIRRTGNVSTLYAAYFPGERDAGFPEPGSVPKQKMGPGGRPSGKSDTGNEVQDGVNSQVRESDRQVITEAQASGDDLRNADEIAKAKAQDSKVKSAEVERKVAEVKANPDAKVGGK